MICLDTSAVIDLILEARDGGRGPVTRRLAQAPTEVVAVSIFVLCELEVGIASASEALRTRKADEIRGAIAELEVLAPSAAHFAAAYGQLVAPLLKGKTPGAMDALIATAALLAGAPLLTADEAFPRVPGLVVEVYAPETAPRRRRRE